MIVTPCIPARGDTKTEFTASALALVNETRGQRPDIGLPPLVEYGHQRIEDARERLVERALAAKADWLLWLDDDHTFPPDALLRLLAHEKPIVGANYPRRSRHRIESTAHRIEARITQPPKSVPLTPKPEGLEPVAFMGFGLLLTKAEIFAKLRRPWFKWGPHGEDGYFCEQAIKAGYQPHVDHALSMEVGHIAETVLTFPR